MHTKYRKKPSQKNIDIEISANAAYGTRVTVVAEQIMEGIYADPDSIIQNRSQMTENTSPSTNVYEIFDSSKQ